MQVDTVTLHVMFTYGAALPLKTSFYSLTVAIHGNPTDLHKKGNKGAMPISALTFRSPYLSQASQAAVSLVLCLSRTRLVMVRYYG